jgi:hypothetical protein
MTNDDSPGCFVVVGIILILLSLFGLWQARLALLHHTVLYSAWMDGRWMNAWQAVAAFILLLLLGLFVLVAALRKIRK